MKSVQATLVFFFVLFLLRILLRRSWLAAAVFVALLRELQRSLGNEYPAVQIPTSIAIFAIVAFAGVRFGLVALAAGLFTVDLIVSAPMPASISSWYAPATAFVFLSVLGFAVGASTRRSERRPLWRGDSLRLSGSRQPLPHPASRCRPRSPW